MVTTARTDPFPSALLGRPAGRHALYLAGLALTVTLLAALVSGARTRTVHAALAAALGLTVLGGVLPAGTTAARVCASPTPERHETCVRRGTSAYCAFPEGTTRLPPQAVRTVTWWGVVDGASAASAPRPYQGLQPLPDEELVPVRALPRAPAPAARPAPIRRSEAFVGSQDPRGSAAHERWAWLLAAVVAVGTPSLRERPSRRTLRPPRSPRPDG